MNSSFFRVAVGPLLQEPTICLMHAHAITLASLYKRGRQTEVFRTVSLSTSKLRSKSCASKSSRGYHSVSQCVEAPAAVCVCMRAPRSCGNLTHTACYAIMVTPSYSCMRGLLCVPLGGMMKIIKCEIR